MHKSWFEMCLLCRLHRWRLLTSDLPIRLCLGKLLHFERFSNGCLSSSRRVVLLHVCLNAVITCTYAGQLNLYALSITYLLFWLTHASISSLFCLSIDQSINQSILFSHKLTKKCLNNSHPPFQLFVLILPHRYLWSYTILYTLPTSSWTQISTLVLTPLK